MRVFSLIFIFYVVALLTQPCEEIFPDLTSDAGRSVVASVNSGSTTETDGEECSPFCICSCCSHPVANQDFTIKASPEALAAIFVQPPAQYTNPYAANHFDSIWQPPKV